MTTKVLLVDDEPNILQGFKRHLRKSYDLELAVGGQAALETIASKGPFAVVVSDMQMPEMSGVELLSRICELNEHTVRIMLTGNADQKTAVDAVNDGKIFRFLSKPCPPEILAQSLDSALEQYRLVTAEAELLNKTLSGSVRMLTQVLSLAMPEAFGLTQEARNLSKAVAERIGIGPMWQVEMAAMLMRVGCVSLPKDALREYLSGEDIRPEHAELIEETPKLGHGLVSAIPRLQGVAEFVLAQNDPPADPTPIASRILRAVGDYQRFHASGSPFSALAKLQDASVYDPAVIDALSDVISETCESREVTVGELREGMVLEANLEDQSGRVLVAMGTEVHEAMIQKLEMLRRSGAGVREPIHVRVTNLDSAPADSTPANA